MNNQINEDDDIGGMVIDEKLIFCMLGILVMTVLMIRGIVGFVADAFWLIHLI